MRHYQIFNHSVILALTAEQNPGGHVVFKVAQKFSSLLYLKATLKVLSPRPVHNFVSTVVVAEHTLSLKVIFQQL